MDRDVLSGYDMLKDECNYGITHFLKHLIDVVRFYEETDENESDAEETWALIGLLLTDIRYIDARCSEGLLFSLIDEYTDVSNRLEEGRCKAHSALRCKDEIIAFSHFVATQSHALDKFHKLPRFAIQHAFNHGTSQRVRNAAGAILHQSSNTGVLLIETAPPPRFDAPSPCLKILEGHTEEILCLDITPDGKRAISGAADSSLMLWNLENGRCLYIFRDHPMPVTSVAMTPDGSRAVSGSQDHTVRVWDLIAMKCIAVIDKFDEPIACVGVTQDGTRIIAGIGGGESGTNKDRSLHVWDWIDSQYRSAAVLKGQTHWITSVQITHDGTKAFSVGGHGHIFVWDLQKNKYDCVIRGHYADDRYSHPIDCISITPDGSTAVTGDWDGCFRVWDLNQSKCIYQNKVSKEYQIKSVSITADGQYAVSGGDDCLVRLWNVTEKALIKTLSGHTSIITSIKITDDATTAVSTSGDIWAGKEKNIRVWDLHASEPMEKQQQEHRVTGLYMTPDGRGIISSCCDHDESIQAELINIVSSAGMDKMMQRLGSKQEPLVLPSIGQGQPVPFPIRLWETSTLECIGKIDARRSAIVFLTPSPDGRHLLTGDGSRMVHIWNLENGVLIKTIKKSQITCAVITPDGQQIVAGGLMDGGNLCAFDFPNGRHLFTLGPKTPHVLRNEAVTVTPDGELVIVGNINGEINIWNWSNLRHTKTLHGHSSAVTCLCVTPDARNLISAGLDNTLFIWDLFTGSRLKKISFQTGSVTRIVIAPDGRSIITGNFDNTLKVWNLQTSDCIGALQAQHPVTAVSDMAVNGLMAYGTAEGHIAVIQTYNLCEDMPVVTAYRLLKYRRSKKWLSFMHPNDSNGQWEDDLSIRCSACRQRFVPAQTLMDDLTHYIKGLPALKIKSPCLDLPFSAWKSEKLKFECPLCHHSLRLNPFIVDNKKLSYKISFSLEED